MTSSLLELEASRAMKRSNPPLAMAYQCNLRELISRLSTQRFGPTTCLDCSSGRDRSTLAFQDLPHFCVTDPMSSITNDVYRVALVIQTGSAQEAGKQTLLATAEVSQKSESKLTGQRKSFLNRHCGLLSCQAAVAGRRYIPKGSFINVVEEVIDTDP